MYPHKVKRMFLEKWRNSNKTNKCVRQIKQYAEDVSYLLRVQSEDSIECASNILRKVFETNAIKQDEEESVNDSIVNNINKYIQCNLCEDCGIENKLKFSECDIMKHCEDEIVVMEWFLAPRQGVNKKGVQNTQLELGVKRYKVKDVVSKLKHQLQQTIIHMTEHKWKSHCMRLDIKMSNPLTT